MSRTLLVLAVLSASAALTACAADPVAPAAREVPGRALKDGEAPPPPPNDSTNARGGSGYLGSGT